MCRSLCDGGLRFMSTTLRVLGRSPQLAFGIDHEAACCANFISLLQAFENLCLFAETPSGLHFSWFESILRRLEEDMLRCSRVDHRLLGAPHPRRTRHRYS